jgi:hypothetical protein
MVVGVMVDEVLRELSSRFTRCFEARVIRLARMHGRGKIFLLMVNAAIVRMAILRYYSSLLGENSSPSTSAEAVLVFYMTIGTSEVD